MINNNRPIRQLLNMANHRNKRRQNPSPNNQSTKNKPTKLKPTSHILKVNYKTIRHHLTILEKNKLVISAGNHYSTAHFLSELMEENYDLFEEITNKTGETRKRTIQVAQR